MNRHEAFYQQVKVFLDLFEPTLVDIGCGSGGAASVIDQRQSIKRIDLVDKRKTRGLDRALASFRAPYELHLAGAEEYDVPADGFVVAVHPCGDLADLAIMKAVAANRPFAVMPCCYSPKMARIPVNKIPDKRRLLYEKPEDFYDECRLAFAREHGYLVFKRQIDSSITPMNNILIGMPISETDN